MRENDRISPILFEIFSCRRGEATCNRETVNTHMSARVEALGAVPGVQEESIVVLDLYELVP